MPATPEQEVEIKAADKALAAAKTKTEIQTLWKAAYLKIGHKALGRLLIGHTAADVASRMGGKAS